MTEGPGRHASEDGDFVDRWLAHRDGASAGGARRSTTSPPAWAPRVTTPASEPEDLAPAPEPEPVVEAAVVEAPAAPVEPVAPVAVLDPPVVIEDSLPEPDVDETFGQEPDQEPDEAFHEEPDEAFDQEAAPSEERPAAPAVAMAPSVPEVPAPIRHTFRPRTRARTAVGVGALLAAGASVLGVYVAARERDAPSIGIAIVLWILTGIIWAVHSGTSVTRLSVRGGQLHVLKQGVRTTIDLTSSYTPVEVHGRPGKHGWKVVFRRRDMTACVIDHSMVDPAEFMRVLRYYRPGVDAEGQ